MISSSRPVKKLGCALTTVANWSSVSPTPNSTEYQSKPETCSASSEKVMGLYILVRSRTVTLSQWWEAMRVSRSITA